jgi:hypothetical protein
VAWEYEIRGQIDQRFLNPDGSSFNSSKASFQVYVAGCAWMIELTELDAQGQPKLRREIGSTGAPETYELVTRLAYQDREPSAKAARKRPAIDQLSTAGFAVSGYVPVGFSDDTLSSHLWVMFASGCFFRDLKTNRMTPVFDYRASASIHPEWTLPIEYELADDLIHLPARLVFRNEGEQYAPVGSRYELRKFPEPYHRGFTNAIYSVTGLTNVDSYVLPLGFVLEEFTGGEGRHADDLQVRKRIKASVSGIQPVCSRTNLLPTITRKTVVTDRRIGNPGAQKPTAYVLPGKQWLQSAEARKLYAMQQRRKRFSIFPLWLTITFVAAAVLPALLLIKKLKRRKT